MELSNVLGYENLHEDYLKLMSRQEAMLKRVKKTKIMMQVEDYTELLEDILSEHEELAYHLSRIKEKTELKKKQNAILMKKIKDTGKAKNAISYFTKVNNFRKLLYVKCELDGEEYHLSIVSMKDLYFDKRLTTPAVLIECQNYTELEQIALSKNIIIGG